MFEFIFIDDGSKNLEKRERIRAVSQADGMSTKPNQSGIRALDLLVPERFDIPAKTLYARFRDLGLKSDWGRWVYVHHLKVWNGYHERPPEKHGLAAFLTGFDEVLDAVKAGLFDFARHPIPLSASGVPLNGAHRIAAAITFDRDIPNLGLAPSNVASPDYSFCFFGAKKDIVPTGLLPSVADSMALEYCRLRARARDMYMVLVFPSARGKEHEIRRILQDHAAVVYRKQVDLTRSGAVQLTSQLYAREKWVGSIENGFKGAREKAGLCFAHEGPVRIYLVQSVQLDEVLRIKHKIRDLFGISNHSVHTNDSFEETLAIGQMLLNENSVSFLNTAVFNTSFKKFWTFLEEFTSAARGSGLEPDDVCLVGSAPLAAFGLRDAGDFDYIYGRREGLIKIGRNSNSHADYIDLYPTSAHDIIYNPTNHFCFHGIKFATLDVIREMKVARWEKKDQEDVKMINYFALTHEAPPRPSLPAITRPTVLRRLLDHRRRKALRKTLR
ncbi:MAG: hypothetical protein IT536_00870 [Hyphomicrobiales bacterium]|nr:hypothetical protein [Hyphomicrobiales bacterium]